jgi:hypothetical protein
MNIAESTATCRKITPVIVNWTHACLTQGIPDSDAKDTYKGSVVDAEPDVALPALATPSFSILLGLSCRASDQPRPVSNRVDIGDRAGDDRCVQKFQTGFYLWECPEHSLSKLVQL